MAGEPDPLGRRPVHAGSHRDGHMCRAPGLFAFVRRVGSQNVFFFLPAMRTISAERLALAMPCGRTRSAFA